MAYDANMPLAFHFTVALGFGSAASGLDNAFQEVSGIEQKMDIQVVQEGGENRFQHQLPNGIKQQPLSLKRGIADYSSPLVRWCKRVLGGGLAAAITLQDVQVCLCNEKRDYVRIWWLYNAFPIRWSVDALNSTKNDVAIETIELAFQYIDRIK
jgi:phage tail-like protein